MMNSQPISIAYTPDSDDAFYYYALQTGRLESPGYELSFQTDHIIALNRAARAGRFDVTAVSSVAYPDLAKDYRILSVGTSVGRGYGPVLVSRGYQSLDQLQGKRIGVAGIPTTGGFLMQWTLPEAQLVEMQFDKIADAILAGELDAGVMIHEELLFYPQKGLHKVADLGKHWTNETGLPLPVGLNIIRRDLGWESSNQLCDLIRQSLHFALKNREDAEAWACGFGRGEEGNCGAQHISMFANADSVLMPQDVRDALAFMLQIVEHVGIADHVPELEFVDGSPEIARELTDALAA